MRVTKGKLLIITSKRPSVTALNCRLLTYFDEQMKYDVLGIRTIITVVTIHSIHGILTVATSWRKGVTSMNGWAGRYGQVLTAGFDGMDRF